MKTNEFEKKINDALRFSKPFDLTYEEYLHLEDVICFGWEDDFKEFADTEDEIEEIECDGIMEFLNRRYIITPILDYAWGGSPASSYVELRLLITNPYSANICTFGDELGLTIHGAFKPIDSQVMFSHLLISLFEKGNLMGDLPSEIWHHNNKILDHVTLMKGLLIMCKSCAEDMLGIDFMIDIYREYYQGDKELNPDNLTDGDRKKAIYNYLQANLKHIKTKI